MVSANQPSSSPTYLMMHELNNQGRSGPGKFRPNEIYNALTKGVGPVGNKYLRTAVEYMKKGGNIMKERGYGIREIAKSYLVDPFFDQFKPAYALSRYNR